MFVYPAEITPMPATGCGRGVSRLIVGGITICEAIRHDEVHHISRIKPLVPAARRFSSLQRKNLLGRSGSIECADTQFLGFGVPRGEPQKSIVAICGGLRFENRNSFARHFETRACEILSIHQQHRIGQTWPPIRWLDPVDSRSTA